MNLIIGFIILVLVFIKCRR